MLNTKQENWAYKLFKLLLRSELIGKLNPDLPRLRDECLNLYTNADNAKTLIIKISLPKLLTVTFLKERSGGKLCFSESTSVKIVNLIVEFFKSIANMYCLLRTSNRRLPKTFE